MFIPISGSGRDENVFVKVLLNHQSEEYVPCANHFIVHKTITEQWINEVALKNHYRNFEYSKNHNELVIKCLHSDQSSWRTSSVLFSEILRQFGILETLGVQVDVVDSAVLSAFEQKIFHLTQDYLDQP